MTERDDIERQQRDDREIQQRETTERDMSSDSTLSTSSLITTPNLIPNSQSDASSALGSANPGIASYKVAVVSQVLAKYPHVSSYLDQIMDEESN